MGILQDIVAEATSNDASVLRLLRLCMVLGSRLPHEPLKSWALSELTGYSIDADVPSYRELSVRNLGEFISGNDQKTFEISTSLLPELLRPRYEHCQFRNSIAECADLASKASRDSQIRIHWPVELAMKYASEHLMNGQCRSAWMEVSPSKLIAIVDVVRTKVLAFALEIEAAAPHAGDVTGTTPPIDRSAVAQIFQTTITGGTFQNLALGTGELTQSARLVVIKGDTASLRAALAGAGVPASDIATLDRAIEEDSTGTQPSMGKRVKGWLADLAIKAASKSAEVGAEGAMKFATKALLAYFGIDTE